MRLDLLVTLKTVDLVRETAWLTLVERLGWGDRLLGLARHRLWRFTVEGADAAVCQSALAAELERSSAYYNPNKERLTWLAADALGAGDALPAPLPRPLGPADALSSWQLGLWVTDEGGAADALRAASAARLSPAVALTALHTGSFWELRLAAANAAEAGALAAALAVSRGRGEGLLLNPHYQEGRLLALAPAPAEVSA